MSLFRCGGGGVVEPTMIYDNFLPSGFTGNKTVDFSDYGINSLVAVGFGIAWSSGPSIAILDCINDTYVVHQNYTQITKNSDTTVTFRNTDSTASRRQKGFAVGVGQNGETIVVIDYQ